ncbi:HECT domain-containing ubiquitin-transferase [Hamiltosporidium magnivora]|uniref:HECT-type E3 ubiquitin transferase n=1 Tax=Hamiltosporidium magnivora TaxID=148818 RepID=A0A4Q9LFX6_9MICR|nr:HECT domain-containing ubiquitin-transferase [Hamiltosporidium magnivora]
MERLTKSVSFIERNQGVKKIVNTLITKDDITDVFLQNHDPFSLSEIGKTCILQWNPLLLKHESFLNLTSKVHFNEMLQIKPFEADVKSKIILIFKYLIYIMRNTFNHELYIIDPSHANYLYSYDLDISYHSFLFHNEFYNDTRYLYNDRTVAYFKSLDLNFYAKKKFEIFPDFDSNKLNLEYSYEEANLMKFKDMSRDYIKDEFINNNILDIDKFNYYSLEFNLIYSEILKHEYYINSEAKKLLAIEIMANLLLAKTHFCYKTEVFLYFMNMLFSLSDLDEYLVNSLSMFADSILLLARYHSEPEECFSFKEIIKDLHDRLGSTDFAILYPTNMRIKNKLRIFCNYLYKDLCKKKEITNILQELDISIIHKIYPYVCNIFYDQSFFKDFVNALLKSNITQSFNTSSLNSNFTAIDNCFKSISYENFENYEDYKKFIILMVDVLAKTMIYTFKDMRLDEQNDFAVSAYKYLYEFTKNIITLDFLVIDHIITKILEVFLYDNNAHLSDYRSKIYHNISKYYFEERKGITVESAFNIMSLISLGSGKNIKLDYPLFLKKFVLICSKNPEISLFLHHFPYIEKDLHKHIEACLSESYSLNVGSVMQMINSKDHITKFDMLCFDNLKKFFALNNFNTSLLSYLKDTDELCTIEFWYFHTFHFIHILSLVKVILNQVNKGLDKISGINNSTEIKIEDNHYLLTSIDIYYDLKRLILNKTVNNLSEIACRVKIFASFSNEIEIMCSTRVINLCELTPTFLKLLIKVNFYLEASQEILKSVLKSEDNSQEYEFIKKIIDNVALIYTKLFTTPLIPHLNTKNMSKLSKKYLCYKYESVLNSEKSIIFRLLDANYLSILKITFALFNLPTLNNPSKSKESLNFGYFLRKIPDYTTICDPNFIWLYSGSINAKTKIFEFYTGQELIDILQLVTNHLVGYYSSLKLNIEEVKGNILMTLLILLKGINSYNNCLIDKYLEMVFAFLGKNIEIFAYEDILKFLKDINASLPNVENIISKSTLFSNVLNLIKKFDENSKIPFIDIFLNDKENSLVYSFLEYLFSEMIYVDFFIEVQKRDYPIFLFVRKQIRKIGSPEAYFIEDVSKLNNYLKILRVNIEANIAYRRSVDYVKENLFISNSYLNLRASEVLLYQISLVRLSNYSNIISKKEIYSKFKILDVLKFIALKYSDHTENKNVIMEYAYAYIRYLFEDRFYLMSSLVYVFEHYDGLPGNISEYFNQKFIYTAETQIDDNTYSNLINDEDVRFNAEIVNDIIEIIKRKQEAYSLRAIALQFLTELVATFPYILHIIKNDIINSFIEDSDFMHTLSDVFTGSNCKEWDLNFRFGYFITVTLYRGSLCFTQELIKRICSIVKEKFDSSFKNYISLIYKILSSEICCCKYIQYINKSTPDFYDKNCKINLEKKKHEIFKSFLSNDILNILLLKFKEFSLTSNEDFAYFKNRVINLINIFLGYIKTGATIRIGEKNLKNSIFRFYILGSDSFMIPSPLIKCKFLEIFEIHELNKKHVEELYEHDINHFSCFKKFDYAYMIKYHNGIEGLTNSKEIGFSNPEISCIVTNFNSDYIYDIKMIKNHFSFKILDHFGQKYYVFKKASKIYCKETLIRVLLKDFYKVESSVTLDTIVTTFYEDIFLSDNFLIRKYKEILSTGESYEEYTSKKLSDIPVNYSVDPIFIYKALVYLCILPDEEYFFETIEQIKKLISFLCLKEMSSEIFCIIFDLEILTYGFEKIRSSYFEKLEYLKKIIIFLIDKKTYMLDDLFIDLLFFEAIFVEKTQHCFLNSIFNSLQSNQNNPIRSLDSSEMNNAYSVSSFINRHKNTRGCILGPLLSIFTVYIEKMKIFLVKTYFEESEKLTIINCFYRELDTFLNSLDETNFYNPPENVKCMLEFFSIIKKNPMKYIFKDFLETENKFYFKVFENYIKMIVKCCQIYSLIKEKIYNDIDFKEFEQNYMREDFICFLYDIDYSKRHINEESIDIHNYKLGHVVDFFNKIHKLSVNDKGIFLKLKCLSTNIKAQSLTNITEMFWEDDLKFVLDIDRKNVIKSTIDCFVKPNKGDFLQNYWKVKFKDEEGRGIGLLYDFFGSYGKALIDEDCFEPFRTLDSTTIIVSFETEYKEILEKYYYTGAIMAKSIIYNSPMGIGFNDYVYLYLIEKTLGLEDLKIVDPTFYKNLISYRTHEDLDSQDLDFTATASVKGTNKAFDLVENGSSMQVTKNNLESYIQKMTEFKIYKNMKPYLDKLEEGFKLVFENDFKELFTPLDFRNILEGNEVVDVDEWKSYTKYIDGFDVNHQVIKWFWNFVEKTDTVTRKKLIYFITGLERLPIGGFGSDKFRENCFKIASVEGTNLLPTSQTCINLLILPLYEDENTFIEKLTYAIEYRAYGVL